MENFKTFMNIAFVILCLVMLWYLFTYDSNSRTRVEPQRRTTQNYPSTNQDTRDARDRYAQENYKDTDRYAEYNYEPPVKEAPAPKRTGIFDRWRNPAPEVNSPPPPQQQQTQNRRDYAGEEQYYEYSSEDPYYAEDYNRNNRNTYQNTPPPRDNYVPQRETYNTGDNADYTAAPPSRPTSSMVYRTKRFSRDGKLGTYRGPMLGGEPHGFAIFEYDNGDMYVGEYRYGQRNGYGNSIFKKRNKIQLRKYQNGDKIVQKNIQGVKYGNVGFVHGGEKGTYIGPVRNGQPHGFGYFKYNNGNMYIGSYQAGKRNGTGNLVYSDGTVVFVEYENGQEIRSSDNL